MEEIGQLLPRVLKDYFSRQKEYLPEVLAPFWGCVAGRAIAANSHPVAFRNGNLTLSVSTDCWATQLRFLTAELRNRINAFFGQPLVARITIRYKRGFAPVSRPELKRADLAERPRLAQKARALLWADADGASLDPVIRDVLENSFVKYFSRPPKGIC